ncbi:MAG: 50S ribosomal protein L35 [Candidatus Omnitrophota bacterium]
MPKLKTKKGVKKRFKLTKTGKIKRAKAGGRHILSKKTRKRKRALRKSDVVDSTMEKKIRRLMPYG